MSFIDVNGLHPARVRLTELRRERTASQCVCCGGDDLAASPAILMPFVAERVFGWKPVAVDESWGLRTIPNGNAYALCNSLRCRGCGHLFCDIRFSDAEMAALYHKYREEEYTSLRDRYEPGYRARNEALNEPVVYVDRIESFLRPHVETPITVLDWGGDTGINTPFKRESEVFDVYDISAKEVEAGARLVTCAQAAASRYRLIVCGMLLEHVPYPSDILLAARQSMDAGSVLYIEVPFEALMRERLESPEQHKKHWHEHINFYSQASLDALVTNCGFQVIDRNILSTTVAGGEVHILQVACRLGASEPIVLGTAPAVFAKRRDGRGNGTTIEARNFRTGAFAEPGEAAPARPRRAAGDRKDGDGSSNLARPEISVVIPCYDEEENAEPIAQAVIQQLETVTDSFEIIFIDNASTDRTVEIVRGLCARDPRIKLIVNTRNFGQVRSPAHAIFQASGRAVIGMVADFQDPPELIPELVRRWRSGADIILGVGEAKKASPAYAAFRKLSYDLQRKFGDYPIIPNATGFGLYDAKAVRAIASLNEPEPFVRGMLVETGFTIETIEFKRPPRAGGYSKNGFFSLLDFALLGLAHSSKGLLRAPLYFSFFTFCATVFTLLGGLYSIAVNMNPRMWLFATLLELQFGLLFLFLGLLGVQVRLISDRTRGTPLVVERERINFTNEG